MGFWGFAPFQNDGALDTYGGYNTSKHLTGLIWQGIKRGVGYSVEVHEIMGMILRTFKVYDGICPEATEHELVRAIATGKFTDATKEAMSGETPMMIMSCATIDFEERKKMLEYAANKMVGIIEASAPSKIESKVEPKTLGDFFEVENKTKCLFDANKMWVQDVSGDEEDTEYQIIYNLARKIINSDFEEVENPMQLTDEQVAWLVDMEKQSDKLGYINHIKNAHKNGMTDIKIRDNEIWRFDNETIKIVEINPKDRFGATKAELGVSDADAGRWLNTYFKNGFYYGKGKLVSIDTKLPLMDEDDDYILFKNNSVSAVSQYVPVYRTKAEYDAAMAKKAKAQQEANKSGIACTNKFYKGTKITAYELTQVNTGQKIVVHPDALKAKIKSGAIKVDNLRLTSDNRLITV